MVGGVYHRLGVVVLLLSLVLTFTGCEDKAYLKYIGDFQTSVDNTTTAVRIYYEELNTFERDLYLQGALYNPRQQLLDLDERGRPTPMKLQVFKEESIQARLDTIKALGKYAKTLSKLAGNDAPTRFAAGTTLLGDNITNLGNTFSQLASKGDTDARNYLQPFAAFAPLAGVIGKAVIEKKRDDAVKKAVLKAGPIVNKIFNLLEADLDKVIGPQRIEGYSLEVARIRQFYNVCGTNFDDKKPRNRAEEEAQRRLKKDFDDERAKRCSGSLSFLDRERILEHLSAGLVKVEAMQGFNPKELIGSMRDAHNELMDYTRSGRKTSDLADLVSVLENFKDRSEEVIDAIRKIKESR